MDDRNLRLSTVHLTEEMCFETLTDEMLQHIAECDYCAEMFADYTQNHMLLSAPQNMADSILKRSRQLDIQMISKSSEASKQLRLILYSLKVGAAALAAITMILKTPVLPVTFGEDGRYHNLRYWRSTNDTIEKFSEKWNHLSIKIFELEDNLND